MATYSRHHPTSRPIPTKTLPITMPSNKAPLSTYPYPVSRVAASPPDSSSYSSSRHSGPSNTYSVPSTSRSAYSSHSARSQRSGSSSYAPSAYNDDDKEYQRGATGVDVTEMLSDRMDRLDVSGRKMGMDRHVARQAQDSGRLNAADRELAELQAMAQRRLKSARVNFAQGVEDAKETRRDLDYCLDRTSQMKEKASRRDPEAYARSATKSRTRSRHE